MPLTLAAVGRYALALPGVVATTKYRYRTWAVGAHGFLWERPLTKADQKRYGDQPLPHGDIVALQVDSLDAKDAILALGLRGVFTIEHFNNYPAVLIELRHALADDVRALIDDAHRAATAKTAPAKRARPTTRRSSSRSRRARP